MMHLIDAWLVSSVQPLVYSGGLLLLAGVVLIRPWDE